MSTDQHLANPNENRQDDESQPGWIGFDEQETYHPVFCLTEVPDEYMEALVAYGHDLDSKCLEISSSSTSNTLEEIKANHARANLRQRRPFRGWIVDQVYAFYKAHLRPDENYAGPGVHFTSFTFLAVDDTCLQGGKERWEVILCSDAPDFGESASEVVLKQLRLPLPIACEQLCSQETLCSTMSTINHRSGLSLSIQPPPMFMPIPGERGAFNIATAAQARENKRKAIEMFKSADEALGPGAEGI